ncbi:catabolite repressor/activator [Phytopseudomonas dryadis]|uniref:Catabolite repressor/activator n=1 Tax=Phytopseudomonas dryadis TaxID=2487520 RepID=A0A4Q9QWI4_9GAMM|nr:MULTISPECIES: catabolite repressor/activator [Pseudomonas]TBU88630.1 catabolite repressor/activator [Pseudomonas dryadis]TBV01648.1 catabolite repressor/activator [Pseudomonas dryadis]TBV14191.1 catabolite repressor/activator [Pseudomonas sp. FRB 230]
MKLSDIARLAGVSLTTASYVINGQAARRRISAATVQRVLDVVEHHGYRPDQQAAGLRRGQSRCLGFVLPDLENPSYARLAKLLEQRARAAGYQLLIASSDDDPTSERQLLELFRSRRCDALIVASCLPQDAPEYRQLVAAGTPVIAVDRALDPAYIHSVVSDDRQAGAQLTESLLDSQPRHVALIGARHELPISQAREQGFRDALRGFGGTLSISHGEQFSRAWGYRQMSALLERGESPDAIVTTAYVLLEGLLDALHERADQDFSQLRLATFGDAQLLDFLPLRVNAISQQHERIAERVFAQVLAALDGGDYQPGLEAIPRILKKRHN